MFSTSFPFITGSTQHLWTEIYCKRSQFIAASILKSAVRLHIKNGIVFFLGIEIVRNSRTLSWSAFFLIYLKQWRTASPLQPNSVSAYYTLRKVLSTLWDELMEITPRLVGSWGTPFGSMWFDTRASSLSGVPKPDICKLKEKESILKKTLTTAE